MKELQEKLIPIQWIYDYWKTWSQELDTKDIILRVSDFDYTLFSRDQSFIDVPELLENRWEKWPKYLFEEYWMNDFLDNQYKNIQLPTEILSQLMPGQDIILTTGIHDWQMWKVRSCKQLNNIQVITTPSPAWKINALISHVLYELKYIPTEIIVYEDRPQYFVEYRDLIQDVLWTKLTIMKVEMDGNDGYKSIEKI